VGEVLNPIRAPRAASMTAFTRASSVGGLRWIESDTAAADHHHVHRPPGQCRARGRTRLRRTGARIDQ
jgi:hypothetical protein